MEFEVCPRLCFWPPAKQVEQRHRAPCMYCAASRAASPGNDFLNGRLTSSWRIVRASTVLLHRCACLRLSSPSKRIRKTSVLVAWIFQLSNLWERQNLCCPSFLLYKTTNLPPTYFSLVSEHVRGEKRRTVEEKKKKQREKSRARTGKRSQRAAHLLPAECKGTNVHRIHCGAFEDIRLWKYTDFCFLLRKLWNNRWSSQPIFNIFDAYTSWSVTCA